MFMTRQKTMMGLLAVFALAASTTLANADKIRFPTYIWTDGPSGEVLAEFVEDFEKKNPGIKIPTANVPYGQFFDKQFVAVSSGNPPDIITVFDADLPRYIESGILEPLEGYIEAAGYSVDKLNRALGAARRGKHLYAISYENNPRTLLYNEKLFKEAGVKVPTNLDEFYEAMKALRDADKDQFGMFSYAASDSSGRLFSALHGWLAGFGAKWTTDGKATANSPEMVKFFEFYKKMYDERLTPRVTEPVGAGMFADGKAAMMIHGFFIAGIVKGKNPETFKHLRTTPLPFPAGGTSATTVFLGIPKDAKNKKEAIKFLMTWLEDKWQLRSLDHMTTVPTRPEVIPADFAEKNKWASGFVGSYKKAASPAPHGAEQYGAEIGKIVQRHFEGMLFNDTMTPKEAADAIQKDLEAFLASKQ